MSSILFVAPPDGGVGDHATATARELERRGIVVRRVTIPRSSNAAWRGVRLALREWRSMRRATIIHVEIGLLDDGVFWFALIASFRCRNILVLAHDVPIVLHAPAAGLVPWQGAWADRIGYRVLGPLFDRHLRRLFNRRVRLGGVLNERAVDAWRRAGVRRVVVVRQGADPPSDPRTPPSASRYVLFAGFIGPTKGLDLLLEVWAEASARSDFELVVAGGNADAGESRYVDRLIERARTVERVRWAGKVDEPTLASLFANAAVVCLPYRSSNPASAIIVRAMVEGRAIVATDVPAFVDALDPRDALIVPAGDAGALSGALARAIDDPRLRDRLGVAVASSAAARFRWSATADDLVAAYQTLDRGFTV